MNLSPKALVEEEVLGSQSSLLSLKPLSIASLIDFEGPMQNKNAEGSTVGSLYDSVKFDALRGHGFVSPLKVFPVVSKGYYLRSCMKVNLDGGFGSDHDPSGIHLSV